jgi:hypothetical protein
MKFTRRGLFALVAGVVSGKATATASFDDIFRASPLVEYLCNKCASADAADAVWTASSGKIVARYVVRTEEAERLIKTALSSE